MDLIEKEKLNLPIELYRKILDFGVCSKIATFIKDMIEMCDCENDPLYFPDAYFEEFQGAYSFCCVCNKYVSDYEIETNNYDTGKKYKSLEKQNPFTLKRKNQRIWENACRGDCNTTYVKHLRFRTLELEDANRKFRNMETIRKANNKLLNFRCNQLQKEVKKLKANIAHMIEMDTNDDRESGLEVWNALYSLFLEPNNLAIKFDGSGEPTVYDHVW